MSDVRHIRNKMACRMWYILRDSTSLLIVDNSISWKWDSLCPPSLHLSHTLLQRSSVSLQFRVVLGAAWSQDQIHINSCEVVQYISLQTLTWEWYQSSVCVCVCVWRHCDRAELKQVTAKQRLWVFVTRDWTILFLLTDLRF